MSNKNILKSLKREEEKKLAGYEMQKKLMCKVTMKLIEQRNYKMLNISSVKESFINERISWHRGMITAYSISLGLMR